MKKQVLLSAVFLAMSFTLLAAPGTVASQLSVNEGDITPEPIFHVDRVSEYPTKIVITCMSPGDDDLENYQIYISVTDMYETEEQAPFELYSRPIDFDCTDYTQYHNSLYNIAIYAVADGMEPSNIIQYQFTLTYIDYCRLCKNENAFAVDGLYYEINPDNSSVTLTYDEIVVDFYDYIPFEMKFWNFTYPDIERLDIPSEITYQGKVYPVTGIGSWSFVGCDQLRSVTIPPSIQTIEGEAFLNNKQIDSVYISDLEAWCNIDFGLITDIFGYSNGTGLLFLNGELVTRLVIPEGVDSLVRTFEYCSSIQSVVLPSSLQYIDNAFSACDNLTRVTCFATTPPEFGDGMDHQFHDADLYVPRASLEAYKAHPEWGSSYLFANIYAIEDLGDVNGDGKLSIADCSSLIDYLLGNTIDGFTAAYADVNGDGQVSISDVSALIDQMLNAN